MLALALGATEPPAPGTGPVDGYVVVGAVIMAGVILVAAGMTANRLLRPHHPTRAKLTSYESGVDPVGVGWQQSNIRYYLYAFLYVVFAVDAVYLFPWATVVARFGLPTLITMAVFVGVLTVGLVHVWKAGVLRWR